jgi:hypothetical protein
MTYATRVEIYKQIEEIRQRPLITYVTSLRNNAMGQMGADVIPFFCRQINKISAENKKIDLLIVSNGGDPIVSWRIMSLLRERFDNVAALLPYQAYSAATLLTLGADEIIMHPFSNLGPVDPQLMYFKPVPGQSDPQKVAFGAEDLRHFIDFVTKDVGISDQEQKERAFELVCKEVGAIPIGVAKRSSNLGLSLGEKLLNLHMNDQNKVKAISESLNKSFYHHGYSVGRKEAKDIGLPIDNVEHDSEIEKLIWNVWVDIEEEMQCNKPFNPFDVVMSNSTLSQQIAPVQQVQIPANLPQPVLQNVMNQILQQQIQVSTTQPVEYQLFQAILESVRERSEYWTKGQINAVRLPDMKIKINVTPITSNWDVINSGS